MFVALIFLGFPLVVALAIGLAIILVSVRKKAKKQAIAILARGSVDNPKEFKRVCGVLSSMTSDLEAIDLWKKLQNLSK